MRSKEREAEKKNASEKKEKSTAQNILGTIAYIVGVCVFVFLILHFVGQRTVVNGSSMDTTLANGQNLVMDKLSYRFHDPERYDIIVFPYQHAENTYYIKRIIGLPGETVQVIDGYMYINGKKLDEHYGAEVMEDPGIAAEPIKLGDDEYFVLGDNRNHSSDSRVASVGVLTRDMLIGRAWVRIYPFNKIGVIKHE
jgi:signal peptidase I